MSQTKLIVDTLKQELRKQGINYRQVAQTLGLSEASVKRLFAESSFTLERIEQICELLHLEVSDLVLQMEHNRELTDQLTLDQETELVSDIKLLLMAHFLMNRLDFYQIIDIYDISETEGIRLLAKLDRMKIIELLPGNRVRLMISENFRLIPGGPIQRLYDQKLQSEFLNSRFNHAGEYKVYVSGMFSRDANGEIIRKIKRLAEDAHDLNQESDSLPLNERFGCSLIMAIRPWEPKIFEDLRRQPNPKTF
ncbi:MAG: helix-turn-helix transcriptional regulator [Gammaproteobacteria bacterium]|nr:MAG: XRE family transcriptional regulator [Gammaproteobacteria bacterium]UCH39058.1 MAG: helix-turn-helix transcriptional regulator [Gammaproteobacteria bacterium]